MLGAHDQRRSSWDSRAATEHDPLGIACGHRGIPSAPADEIRELIATMASQNPLWGTERIRGELLKARHRGQISLDPLLVFSRSRPEKRPDAPYASVLEAGEEIV